ncbi:MAG: asparaginase [candidate division Zixibacteria bacterium]|nr:asparaginase [candidate division Zixibacteria bacterium]
MAELVAKVYRGKREESVHYGSVAVVDRDGKLTHSVGDPEFFTFVRSSSKPFQLIPLLRTGAADTYEFSQKQISIMCGSHIGTDDHRATVLWNLETAGNKPEDLQCGVHTPLFMTMANKIPEHGEHLDVLRHNCSGKHSGFLALSRFLGEDVANYLNVNSMAQKMILDAIVEMYEYPKEDIVIAVDGCSAPNFGIPLSRTAVAFKKLALAQGQTPEMTEVLTRITAAMTAYPEMFSGEGRFDLALMRAFPDRMICKGGAEAIQGMALTDPEIGIAVKIHDGNARALYPVCCEVLRQLGIEPDAERETHLATFRKPEVRNLRNLLTGYIVPEFTLKKT